MTGKEIEVGELVRTIYGEIFKIVSTTKQKEKYVFVDKNVDRYEDRAENDNVLNITEIVKHSKNLIDLIKAKDIVVYKLRGLKFTKMGIVKEIQDAITSETRLQVGLYSLEQLNILRILTAEQFTANCYVVEEE